jgi:hypothetical protein
MFGLEILDVVIGLTFVYLLLSLLATALNEYVSALMNLRGKELARGLGRLLDDLDEKQALRKAFDGVGPALTGATATLTERFYNHRLIRPLATRRGWAFRAFSEEPRLPSYIPARTFAMALLDVLGYKEPSADDPAPPAGAEAQGTALLGIMSILKRESPLDVSELKGLLATSGMPEPVQVRLLEAFTGSQSRLQHLHDGVEVWFNNAMDRVSGAYKRNIQGWLFALGLLIAACSNADTIDMWTRLSSNDELAKAMADRAERYVPTVEQQVERIRGGNSATDTTDARADTTNTGIVDTAGTSVQADSRPPADTTSARDSLATDTTAAGNAARDSVQKDSAAADSTGPKTPADSAWVRYKIARAQLDSMELKLGWTRHEAMRIGLMPTDSTFMGKAPRFYAPLNFPFWGKLLGLLLTALAISLGAPFWFDLLNKVISIRSAGRSPAEKPKSPEGAAKRIAEQTPK